MGGEVRKIHFHILPSTQHDEQEHGIAARGCARETAKVMEGVKEFYRSFWITFVLCAKYILAT